MPPSIAKGNIIEQQIMVRKQPNIQDDALAQLSEKELAVVVIT